MNMQKNFFTGLVVAVALIAVYGLMIFYNASKARPNFLKSGFTVTRADGQKQVFEAEVARTDLEQAYGLMFIKSMPSDVGMIFPYEPPRQVAFWMKDTFIPLDMLFVAPDHRIGKIVTFAKPHDLSPISSDQVVSAVIEINGGEANKQGIAVGDKVDSDAISQ
jgi:uncharacterized membrane protein (UPF0127 family)